MNVLLLDDEAGIREGLAAILRRKGHRVCTADSLAAGLAHLDGETFDLVVSDWRLPDGVADPLLDRAQCPVVVVSGHPDEVCGRDHVWKVLAKPVPPEQLVELVAGLEQDGADSGRDVPVAADHLDPLPADCRRVLRAALAHLRPERYEVVDDGSFVVLRAPLRAGERPCLRALEALGGDLRVLAPESGPVVELRVFRDARPREGMPVVSPMGPWPDSAEFAVDLDREEVSPQVFLELLDRATRVADTGRRVHFLNVPGHLRFFAEVCGRGHDMPIREKAGPHLPEVLTSLWS